MARKPDVMRPIGVRHETGKSGQRFKRDGKTDEDLQPNFPPLLILLVLPPRLDLAWLALSMLLPDRLESWSSFRDGPVFETSSDVANRGSRA